MSVLPEEYWLSIVGDDNVEMFPLQRPRLDSGSVFTRLATELLGSHIFNVKVDTHAVSGRHMFGVCVA